MWSTDPGQHWVKWGETDPYYGVLSSDEYHVGMDASARARFFSSGEVAIDAALATIRSLDPSCRPRRALDFGCGVGRTTLALARRCEQVIGIDIAPAMLSEAARNAAAAGLTNLEWVQSDPGLTRLQGGFDLIYSSIVLHHIRAETGLPILRRLVSLLNPGGVIVFQVLYRLHQPKLVQAARWVQARVPLAHSLVNLLRGRPLSTPNMEGNVYPLAEVLDLLQEGG